MSFFLHVVCKRLRFPWANCNAACAAQVKDFQANGPIRVRCARVLPAWLNVAGILARSGRLHPAASIVAEDTRPTDFDDDLHRGSGRSFVPCRNGVGDALMVVADLYLLARLGFGG